MRAAFDPPIMDGVWLPITELEGTSMVDDVCDMFDGPRLPYGLDDGAYEPYVCCKIKLIILILSSSSCGMLGNKYKYFNHFHSIFIHHGGGEWRNAT